MLPRFKYLSVKLFSPKKSDHDGRVRARDGSWDSSTRTQSLPGELITVIRTGVISSRTKEDGTLTSGGSGGLFANASNFTMNNATFIDNSQTTNYVRIDFSVFLTLKSASAPEAILNSAARHPPPKCHPGSRETINKILEKWLFDFYRQRKMTWLYGPPGVGKSAVAQTFGELADERGYLGAAFFSAYNDLPSDSSRIIPTLAYQLAIRNSGYKQLVNHKLAEDPTILEANLAVQFQKLIIEPFSSTTSPGREQTANGQSYVIILDGLDECKDERAQCELIELINQAAQKNDLPLIWLLCSRPESHIKYTFSQLEFVRSCDRAELVIDDEARADVERFLRESFEKIHKHFRVAITIWPPEVAFNMISKAVSGYFVFASAAMRVVGDPVVGDPESQLVALLRMLQGLDDIGMNSPLEALDIFYSRILSRIREHLIPTAIQILGICARLGPFRDGISSAEELRLFLRIDKAKFYLSLEKLHSVVRVPFPEDRQKERLSFYHKSFADYLLKERRSGKFCISDARAQVLLATNSLHWYCHILVNNSRDLVRPDEYNQSRASLDQWSFKNEIEWDTLAQLTEVAQEYFDSSIESVTESNTDFFDALCQFNFGLLKRTIDGQFVWYLLQFVHLWDWSRASAGPYFVRTEVFDEAVDRKLFRHLSTLTNGILIPPIDVHEPVVYNSRGRPLRWKGLQTGTMGYVIIGRGSKSGLICCYQAEKDDLKTIVLNSLAQPTTAQISEYRSWTEEVEQLGK